MRVSSPIGAIVATSFLLAGAVSADWVNWRGPNQNGTSLERYEGWEFPDEPAWTLAVKGRGIPVVFDGRLFSFGYTGEQQDTTEIMSAVDAKTGEIIWQDEIRDFLSDTAYDRYSIGAPTVDPETRNVYIMTTNGMFRCYSFDGERQWDVSMMERFGRLTFPNGRVGSPVIEGDLVIVRGITAYWGADGPARDRFYAFDKRTGELIWSATPGDQPTDSSYSTPIVETRDGKRVFYAGTGCGNLVAVNARNGQPLWRFQMSVGGVNSSPVIYKDTVICIHDMENLDSSESGRMVAIRIPDDLDALDGQPLGADAEVWRNPLAMFSSSPVLVGDRVYQVTKTGTLACVDAATGRIFWDEKLGTSNLHSSPLYADGLLYVPIQDGKLYIIRPSDEKAEIVKVVELEGNLLGAPALCDGYFYLHTMEKLYCFKLKHTALKADPAPETELPKPGKAVAIQVVPSDVLLRQGESQKVRLRSVDAAGFVVGDVDGSKAKWESFIPPTARVKAEMDGAFDDSGTLVVGPKAKTSAGAFKVTVDGLSGLLRGRVLPALPYEETFEEFDLAETSEAGAKFAYPPLSWIGARFKFDIEEREGDKVFAKNLDRILFQRAVAFIGDPKLSSYTLQADVLSEGNRRKKMDVGVVNQRYEIVLKGNYNQIEISSNQERLKESVPFPIQANTWYTLKTSVVTNDDGSGVVKAKAWPRGTDEPEAWNFELPVPKVHREGAPGLYGFALQNQMKVYVDNIRITPNP